MAISGVGWGDLAWTGRWRCRGLWGVFGSGEEMPRRSGASPYQRVSVEPAGWPIRGDTAPIFDPQWACADHPADRQTLPRCVATIVDLDQRRKASLADGPGGCPPPRRPSRTRVIGLFDRSDFTRFVSAECSKLA